jgi:hypothetical protein
MLTGRRVTSAIAVAACSLAIAGCGGGDETPAPATTSETAGGITPPGTELGLDDPAVVELAAGKKQTSTVRVTVTGVQQGAAKDLAEFRLNDAERKSGVFYVRATVRNLGHHDVGGAFVTLYGRVSDSLVVRPVVFGSTFGKCNDEPLPKPFGRGKRADVCMVMLAPRHGSLSAVEWRFSGKQVDDAPISWELP